ncbi:MAG: 4Fe-4S dicluster domain-containing protein [Nitrospinota bacterium]
MDRRTFLQEGPLAFLQAVLHGGSKEDPRPGNGSDSLLRPPGAAPEAEFLELCCGIGACAEACPANAIQLVARPGDPARLTPVIVPSEAACIVCEELACTKACPSGALLPVAREEIRIGVARICADECLAWTNTDPGCDYCVDRCPLGSRAIAMDRVEQRRRPVVKEGCIGCGVCEYYCPTRPSAIRVYGRDRYYRED